MRAVNLLPQDEIRRDPGLSRLPLLAVAGGAAAVTVVAAMTFLSAGNEADGLRAEVAAVEAAIARIPKAPAPALAPAALQQERTDRLAALGAAVSGRIAFDRLLRELSLVLPTDAWLTGITAAAPTPTSPTTAGTPATKAATDVERGVTIQGATYSHESVARVLARLAALPSLEHVTLTATALVEPEQATAPTGSKTSQKAAPARRQKPVVTFTVLASVKPGGAS
jgi:Tfp pilus assembly protein PilN